MHRLNLPGSNIGYRKTKQFHTPQNRSVGGVGYRKTKQFHTRQSRSVGGVGYHKTKVNDKTNPDLEKQTRLQTE